MKCSGQCDRSLGVKAPLFRERCPELCFRSEDHSGFCRCQKHQARYEKERDKKKKAKEESEALEKRNSDFFEIVQGSLISVNKNRLLNDLYKIARTFFDKREYGDELAVRAAIVRIENDGKP